MDARSPKPATATRPPGCGAALPKSRLSLKNAAVTLRRCCLLEQVRLNSGMIGKIEKAHRYAEERNRFRFSGLAVTVHGDNDDHEVRFEAGALVAAVTSTATNPCVRTPWPWNGSWAGCSQSRRQAPRHNPRQSPGRRRGGRSEVRD